MRIIGFLIVSSLLFSAFSCSTAPEFERDNPYDIAPYENDLRFPPSTSEYRFRPDGLLIEIPGVYRGSRNLKIERKNGNTEFEEIAVLTVGSHFTFLDTDIIGIESFGYPLEYKLSNYIGSRLESVRFIKINFGEIWDLSSTETEDSLIISWEDSVFLNNGTDVLKRKDNQATFVSDLPSSVSYFSIPRTLENLTSEFLISPYKYFGDEKSYLDTTFYNFKPSAPTNFDFEIISGNEIKLTWIDNSESETGYQLINNRTNDVYTIPEDSESFIVTKSLNSLERESFSLYVLFEEVQSLPARIDTTIPDFPYPTIIDIEHISENVFRIHFEDNVSFNRNIHFSIGDKSFSASNTGGYVEIDAAWFSESYDLKFSADLSYGRYGEKSIPVAYRSSLLKLATIETGESTNPKIIDVRTVGNILIYGNNKDIYKVDLEALQQSKLMTLSENLSLVRISNDNNKALLLTDTFAYLVNLETGVIIQEIVTIPKTIFDASFISNDSEILLSTDEGLIIYSISTSGISAVPGFDSPVEYELIGDATKTRLLAFDRSNSLVHYFNTIGQFEYYTSVQIDNNAINGGYSEITNISHFSTSNNSAAFKNGGVLEYENGQSCSAPDNCYYGFFGPFNRNKNAFVQILNIRHRLIATENYIRLVDKHNINNIHVIERPSTTINWLKVNFDSGIAVEFHPETWEIHFYDISKKWSFTNYGVYEDIVWPEN